MLDVDHPRTLGTGGLSVSPIGLGCMGMSRASKTADEAQSIDVIHHALDAGVTFLDTANAYGFGHNEGLVGRAIAGRNEEIVIGTKFGIYRNTDGATAVNGRPEMVAPSCEESLRLLGVDVIDLFYLHRVDPDVPIEDTVGAMAALVASGKVRHLGLCEASVDTLERAASVHPIAALQMEWSLWTRDIEEEILPAARRLGIGVVAYCPLGRGFLAGAVDETTTFDPDDYRGHNARYKDGNLRDNREVLARVIALAERRGVTVGQFALAWLLAQGLDVVPIPGTTSPSHLDENVHACDIDLSADEVRQLDQLAPPSAWRGERYEPGTLLTYSTTRPRSRS